MKASHAINVLFKEHPEWGKIPRKQLAVTSRDGWSCIAYKGVEIERVRVDGRFIFEEWLGHSRNPKDYR